MYMQKEEEYRYFDLANTEPDAPLPLTVTSRVHQSLLHFDTERGVIGNELI